MNHAIDYEKLSVRDIEIPEIASPKSRTFHDFPAVYMFYCHALPLLTP